MIAHKDKAALDKLNRAYSSEPWWYDLRGFLILKFAYRTTLISQIRLFSQGMRLEHLEVAVGSGSLLRIILFYRTLTGKDKCHITAFDYSERMLAGAINRFSGKENMKFLLADAAELPFSDRAFDSVNIANAIHCLPRIEKSFAEVFRVLKVNGLVTGNVLLYPKGQSFMDRVATMINNWGIKKGILFRPYDKHEIESLLNQVGFKIISLEISGNSLDFKVTKE